MLLIKHTEKIKLDRPASKVLKLSTALDGFIFVTTTEESFEKLVHIDKLGKTLWQKKYVDSIDTFGMFNEREVIVMNVAQRQVEVVDLLTHTVKAYPHEYVFDDTSSMDILVFNQSKLFCIVQRGSHSDHRLFLTYYAYQHDHVRPISAYKSQQGEWHYEQPVAKVNNHSKIAWWRPKHDGILQFSTFKLSEDLSGSLQTVKANITLGTDYKVNNFALELTSLWQTSPDIYMMVCNTNRDNRQEVTPNNNYILDARKEIIRETKFTFPDKWNSKLIDYFNLGEISAFHTFHAEKDKGRLPSPVFYIHNEREEIIASEEWTATSKVNFYIPGFDTSTIIEAVHELGDVSEIEVTTKRLMTPKEMYLHFMLHINEDFDDDLLQDAVDLLTGE